MTFLHYEASVEIVRLSLLFALFEAPCAEFAKRRIRKQKQFLETSTVRKARYKTKLISSVSLS